MADFWPSSLMGCLNKILENVLANNFSKVVGSVISESHSAFIKGRKIIDGILIANEMVDDTRSLTKELLLLKVNFEKTFDSVDWWYLEDVMVRMNFSTLWRKGF